jgi:hypothetical protein
MIASLVFSRFIFSFRPWGQAWPDEEVPSRLPLSPKVWKGPSELNTVQPIGRGMNSAIEVRFAHGDLVHRPAIRAIDVQRCLPRRAKALRVGLDAGGHFAMSLWTAEKQ